MNSVSFSDEVATESAKNYPGDCSWLEKQRKKTRTCHNWAVVRALSQVH